MPLDTTKLDIGQVIYVLSEKETKIIPAVISEQASVKTLSGTTVKWKVLLGPEGKRRNLELDKIKGEKYSSLDEVENVLEERLKKFLKQTIMEGKSREKSWYKEYATIEKKPEPVKQETEIDEDQIDPGSLVNDFDESPGYYELPQEKITNTDSPEEIRRKIERQVISDDDDDDDDSTSVTVTLPGGEKRKVSL